MVSILCKWLLAAHFLWAQAVMPAHPIYVSVVEIEHNAAEKSLEISCRIFTDDFEKTLREIYPVKVDLLNPAMHEAMGKYVSGYVRDHFKLSVNGKPVSLRYLGYEEVEEAISSYYQVDGVESVGRIDIENDILYSYKQEQMGIMHLTVKGERKSLRLLNPDKKATVSF